MSTLNFGITKENRRGWFLVALLAVLLLAGAAAWYIWAGAAPGAAVNDQPAKSPAALWESQAIDNYRYTLQVGCFCLVDVTRPVIVEVKDGQVASITYADDGTAADPALFERYDSIDKLLAIINEAEAQGAARLDVSYDEATGVPQSIVIDISEQMADEELYLDVSGFEVVTE
jgi:hypothetical protein